VIVPLYNKGAYVGRALRSILSQDLSDFEIIVVDDGSTDDGAEVVRQHRDPRIRLIQQPNRGPGAARNEGLRLSQGPLAAFLDADDEWLPTYLAQAVAALQGAGEEVATHTCTYIEEPGGKDSTTLWRQRGFQSGTFRMTAADSSEVLLHRVAFMSPCTTMVRTRVARDLGGFCETDGCRNAEDAHLWLRVLLTAKVSFLVEPHVRIHRDASGLSATKRLSSRPLEPFLARPDEVRALCPPDLREILEEFLAIRAFKTACAWSYWGKWSDARMLLRSFDAPGRHRLPYYWLAHMAATPAGSAMGVLARVLSGLRTPQT